MTTDASFEEFVAVHGPGLLLFARALVGHPADAEDLLQNALTSAYARWPRIRPEGALAYVRRSVANGRFLGDLQTDNWVAWDLRIMDSHARQVATRVLGPMAR